MLVKLKRYVRNLFSKEEEYHCKCEVCNSHIRGLLHALKFLGFSHEELLKACILYEKEITLLQLRNHFLKHNLSTVLL